MTFLTIQEAAKLLNCSPRSVYRKLDSIDAFDNLVKKGFAKWELHNNGNNRRLINEDWLKATFVKNDKARQSKISSLDVKAFDIFEKQLDPVSKSKTNRFMFCDGFYIFLNIGRRA